MSILSSLTEIDPGSMKMTLSVILVGLAGMDFLILEPGVVGAMVDYSGLTQQQAGQIAATHMAGATFGTFFVTVVVSKVNLNKLVSLALGLIIAAELALIGFDSMITLGTARFFAGLGDGLLMATAFAVIGGMQQADRVFGLLVFAHFLSGALVFPLLPFGLPMVGIEGLYIGFAAMAILALCTMRWFPAHVRAEISGRGSTRLPWVSAVICLCAFLLLYMPNGALWAYLERIGHEAGISTQVLGFSLSASLIVGLPGAMLPALIGLRFGRTLPLLIGMVSIIVSVLLLVGSFGAIQYAVAVCLFNFSLAYTVPYFLGLQGSLDPEGRIVAAGATITYAGLALGSAIGSLLIEDGFTNFLWVAIAVFGISLAATMIVVVPREGLFGRRASDVSAGLV